jgi:hypothetical protein
VALGLLMLTLLVSGCAQPGPGTNNQQGAVTLEDSQRIAEDFVLNSPTFAFDGMRESLKLTKTLEISVPYAWTFEFIYDSRQAGYGDRTGQMLLQVITPHLASITVEQGDIVFGRLDGKWDMLEQQELVGQIGPDDAVTPPAPDFIGWVTQIEPVGRNQVVGRILVESQTDKVVRKIWVTINAETEIYRGASEEGNMVDFAAAELKQQAHVWFDGPVRESYPEQVDAQKVVLVTTSQ